MNHKWYQAILPLNRKSMMIIRNQIVIWKLMLELRCRKTFIKWLDWLEGL